MKFFPIIALCDLHVAELKEQLQPMPDPLELTLQERTVRAACDFDREDRKYCSVANHWYYLHVELVGWQQKKAGTKGGAARTEAKISASRSNGAKGGRPRKHLTIVEQTVEPAAGEHES